MSGLHEVQMAQLKVDESEAVARRYAVRGIPTLIQFQHGIERQLVMGAASETTISLVIDRYPGITEVGG